METTTASPVSFTAQAEPPPTANAEADWPWPSPESFPLLPDPKKFLLSFCSTALELARNIYIADRPLHILPASGAITTNLCEDIMYLISAQIDAAEEYLAVMRGKTSLSSGYQDCEYEEDDVRAEAVYGILHALYCRQIRFRDALLIDLEGCCAAANDFDRLMDRMEGWASDIGARYPLLRLVGKERSEQAGFVPPQRELSDLVQLYAADASYAARAAHWFVFESVRSSPIDTRLFRNEWEEEYIPSVHQENSGEAQSLILTIQDYLTDMEGYFGDSKAPLFRKALEALISATVVFYLCCLLCKMDQLCRNKDKSRNKFSPKGTISSHNFFSDPPRAGSRMGADIFVLKSFFKSWVLEIPSLDFTIEKEFANLVAINTLFSLMTNESCAQLDEVALSSVGVLLETADHNTAVVECFLSDLRCLALSGRKIEDLPQVVSSDFWQTLGNQPPTERSRFSSWQRSYTPDLEIRDVLFCYFDREKFLNKTQAAQALNKKNKKLQKLTRRTAVKAMKADIRKAREKMQKLPVSKKKMKKRAVSFLNTCKRAGMI